MLIWVFQINRNSTDGPLPALSIRVKLPMSIVATLAWLALGAVVERVASAGQPSGQPQRPPQYTHQVFEAPHVDRLDMAETSLARETP